MGIQGYGVFCLTEDLYDFRKDGDCYFFGSYGSNWKTDGSVYSGEKVFADSFLLQGGKGFGHLALASNHSQVCVFLSQAPTKSCFVMDMAVGDYYVVGAEEVMVFIEE